MNILPVILFLISFVSVIGKGEPASAMEWVEDSAKYMRRLAAPKDDDARDEACRLLQATVQQHLGPIIAATLRGTQLLGRVYNEANAFQDAAGVEVISLHVMPHEVPDAQGEDPKRRLILTLEQPPIRDDFCISPTLTLTTAGIGVTVAARFWVRNVTDPALCALVRVARGEVLQPRTLEVPLQVTAKERLALVQRLLRENPDFTAETPHERIAQMYEADMRFIHSATASRPDAEWIRKNVIFLDALVQERGGHENMSFNHHTGIAACLALILSPSAEEEASQESTMPRFQENLMESFCALLIAKSSAEFEQTQPPLYLYSKFKDCACSVFALAHLSPNGAVGIDTMLDGYGFWGNGKHHPYSVAFLGVPTAKEVAFDGLDKQRCELAFWHDGIHMENNNFTNAYPDRPTPQILAAKVAHFRDRLCTVPLADEERRTIVHTMWYYLHEVTEPSKEIAGNNFVLFIQSELKKLTLPSRALCSSKIEKLHQKLSIQIACKGAKSLKLPVVLPPHEDTFEEAELSLYRLRLRGCELLLAPRDGGPSLAQLFDAAGKEE